MKRLNTIQRKWLLALHIIFSAIMLGVAVAFLILSITAANTKDSGVLQACYTSMHVLADTSVRASTIGSAVTGILLSVLTSWGLFKFYWIIAKEVLTLLAIVIGPIGMYIWTLKAMTMTEQYGTMALQHHDFIVNSGQLWVGIVLQLISLVAMFILSVFKPWGLRRPAGSRHVAAK